MKRLAVLMTICLLPLSAQAVIERSTSTTDVEAAAEAAAAKILDVPLYLAQRESDMEEARNGQYGRIPRPEMGRLQTSYDTIVRLLDGQDSIEALSTPQKVELFNAQQTFLSILEHQSETAVICERTRHIGSNIRRTACATRAERDLRREAEQDGMRTNHMTPPCMGCGGP